MGVAKPHRVIQCEFKIRLSLLERTDEDERETSDV
jgi:hypothetical protein